MPGYTFVFGDPGSSQTEITSIPNATDLQRMEPDDRLQMGQDRAMATAHPCIKASARRLEGQRQGRATPRPQLSSRLTMIGDKILIHDRKRWLTGHARYDVLLLSCFYVSRNIHSHRGQIRTLSKTRRRRAIRRRADDMPAATWERGAPARIRIAVEHIHAVCGPSNTQSRCGVQTSSSYRLLQRSGHAPRNRWPICLARLAEII